MFTANAGICYNEPISKNGERNMFRYAFCLLAFLSVSLNTYSQNTPKVLVVYYSRTGNTQMVAEKIAEKFNADSERLIDKVKRTGPVGFTRAGKDALAGNLTEIEPLKADPQKYDIILIGTPSWFSNITPAVRTFVTQYDISSKKLGLFGTVNKIGIESALKQLAELISKGRGKQYPSLALHSRDLKTQDVLQEKIDVFYQEIRE